MTDLFIEKGATFSPCRTWRYGLWRVWERRRRLLVVVGLNPSTADETEDDPTIRRDMGYARRWDCGGLYKLNMFGFRATDPKDMLSAADPVGPDNKAEFEKVLSAPIAPEVLCAWGAHGAYRDQDRAVMRWLAEFGAQPLCLGLTKAGLPRHTLYMRKDVEPVPYKGRSVHEA